VLKIEGWMERIKNQMVCILAILKLVNVIFMFGPNIG
jgi:hypothetical protein